ncbi:neuferricin isoform X1 [Oncorhynchus nerka]|uniref:neuferricin isoform X1 n=1 Tax=Oncorhynchus nerka TaxID=8023 RepID=UPI00112FD7FF|nr:neuferricin isoform X1 [Oncorhynchus nerka]
MLGFIISFIFVLVAILLLRQDWANITGDAPHSTVPPARLIIKDELSLYTGEENSKGLYLAILGQVFDVEKGMKHYGPGGGYRFFAGKDASLSFVTGDFTDTGLTDDLSSLSPAQVVSLYDWLAFYHKDYEPVGRLVGRFYSESGEPTEALLQVEAALEQGRRLKDQALAEKQHLPACNSEWNAARRGRVWCSTKSGGVQRDWAGVPRKLFSPGSGRSRCVCVQNSSTLENPNIQEYEDCPPHADSCPVRE